EAQSDHVAEPESVKAVGGVSQDSEEVKLAEDIQREQISEVTPETQPDIVADADPAKVVEDVIQEQAFEITPGLQSNVAAEPDPDKSETIHDSEQGNLAEDIQQEQASEASPKANDISQQETAKILRDTPLEEAHNS